MAGNLLTLGWRVSGSRDPVYWLNERPRPGLQADADLVCVPPGSLATHLALIAQSGSGKSYFLGRLVEEILVHTRARCVILDPNADFRFANIVEPYSLWRNAKYDRQSRTGKLPHEKSRHIFERDWRKVTKKIRLGPHAIRGGNSDVRSPYSPLRILLRDLSADFLLDETEYSLRHQIYHCHEFIRQVALLFELRFYSTGESVDSLDQAEVIFSRLHGLPKEEQVKQLVGLLDIKELVRRSRKDKSSPEMIPALAGHLGDEVRARIWQHTISAAAGRAASGLLYASPETARIYFGLLRRQVDRGVLLADSGIGDSALEQPRLTIIDLPSLPDPMTRRLVVNAVLAGEWDHARKAWSVALQGDAERDERVPTFIIVDEAHNLLPAQASSTAEAALREQFRIIAAEGRKYGLFLILVSQRPDKLDSMIISECENRAVMRLGAPSLVPLTRELLDLSDVPERVLAKCLEFELGRALIIGRWAPDGPQILMSGARRTREGGRNLRAEFWTAPAWSGR